MVKELDADEMQTFLRDLDVDLDDMTWGRENKGGTASSWIDLMSPEDAAKYNNWINLREAGLDQVKINVD